VRIEANDVARDDPLVVLSSSPDDVGEVSLSADSVRVVEIDPSTRAPLRYLPSWRVDDDLEIANHDQLPQCVALEWAARAPRSRDDDDRQQHRRGHLQPRSHLGARTITAPRGTEASKTQADSSNSGRTATRRTPRA
jgi:hypothetical protein